ncbi:MAG: hypothetical protein JWO37_514 [Acidimicrobiales bacterium]|nr:hypothetical protein [Acidimicrobiales bacterium]
MTDVAPTGDAGLRPNDAVARVSRLTEVMRAARPRRLSHDRKLALAGSVLAPTGVVLVLLGWWGAAGSAREYEQIPFLISGGILGLALLVAGTGLLVGAWLTRLVTAARTTAAHAEDTAADVRRIAVAIERLEATMTANTTAAAPRRARRANA